MTSTYSGLDDAPIHVYDTAYSTIADDLLPWEEDGWVPTLKSGKQKSPNMIRNELQRYIDQCKAEGTSTQTQIIEEMGVNNNTFRRFMNPKTYKDQWSACQNGTYWAAARLLERVKHEKEEAKKAAKKSGKRKILADEESGAAGKKSKVQSTLFGQPATATLSKAEAKAQALNLIQSVNAVEDVSSEDQVFDSCPQLVQKMKDFLQREGMTKSLLLEALGNINSNSLNRFLSGKKQDQCANIAYRQGYVFFEKLRIFENKEKSRARLKNEAENPSGFSLDRPRTHMWVFTGNMY